MELVVKALEEEVGVQRGRSLRVGRIGLARREDLPESDEVIGECRTGFGGRCRLRQLHGTDQFSSLRALLGAERIGQIQDLRQREVSVTRLEFVETIVGVGF